VSENALETVRATVQDFIAPELKTHGVRLEGLERRVDDARHSLEQRIDDTKDVLRAEIKALDAKMDGRFAALEAKMDGTFGSLEAKMDGQFGSLEGRFVAMDSRFAVLEGLIRNLTQQVTFESGMRERMASLEARMPKQ
jgi:hypothetical protein